MPNWCVNELEVVINDPSTSATELKRFIKTACSKTDGEITLDFDKIIPYPKRFKMLDDKQRKWMKEHPDDWANAPKDGFNNGGYDWCVNNWGTKWSASCRSHVQNDYDLILNFDTAWAPPIPVINKLIAMFPLLNFNFQYWECGCGFQGGLAGSAGEVTGEWDSEYHGNKGG